MQFVQCVWYYLQVVVVDLDCGVVCGFGGGGFGEFVVYLQEYLLVVFVEVCVFLEYVQYWLECFFGEVFVEDVYFLFVQWYVCGGQGWIVFGIYCQVGLEWIVFGIVDFLCYL